MESPLECWFRFHFSSSQNFRKTCLPKRRQAKAYILYAGTKALHTNPGYFTVKLYSDCSMCVS